MNFYKGGKIIIKLVAFLFCVLISFYCCSCSRTNLNFVSLTLKTDTNTLEGHTPLYSRKCDGFTTTRDGKSKLVSLLVRYLPEAKLIIQFESSHFPPTVREEFLIHLVESLAPLASFNELYPVEKEREELGIERPPPLVLSQIDLRNISGIIVPPISLKTVKNTLMKKAIEQIINENGPISNLNSLTQLFPILKKENAYLFVSQPELSIPTLRSFLNYTQTNLIFKNNNPIKNFYFENTVYNGTVATQIIKLPEKKVFLEQIAHQLLRPHQRLAKFLTLPSSNLLQAMQLLQKNKNNSIA